MSDRLISNLPVRNLEWLFTPPGLPVPGRLPGVTPSTSILVRGAAGTGKTTLALALALGIARDLGGRVYYLSTEIAPVDVRFKLKHLSLPVEAVAPLSAVTPNALILTEHLLLVADEEAIQPPHRTEAALERAAEVAFEFSGQGVRVLVIDAFSLVGETDRNPSMRKKLAELIQALDSLGLSVVLVEEAPVVGADWASFVADVVFELDWGEDADTHARVRQLSVPKSRFSPAAYGPHDYGLDYDALAVWPDIGHVSIPHLAQALGLRHPILLGKGNHAIHKLVGSNYSNRGEAIRLIESTPWLRRLSVEMQGVVRVGEVSVPHSEGPASVIWSILHNLFASNFEVVVVQDPEFALARTRYAVPFFGALQMLSHLGVMVVIHGSGNELQRVPAAFSFADPPREVARKMHPAGLDRLKGTEVNLLQRMQEFRNGCSANGAPTGDQVRWWAIGHAYYLGETLALDWFLSRGEATPEEAPFVRHALSDVGRLEEAYSMIPPGDPLRAWLEAELDLASFDQVRVARARAVYATLLASPAVSQPDKELLQYQLKFVEGMTQN